MHSPAHETETAIRLPAVFAIGFTGHRNLQNEARLRTLIREYLRERMTSGHVKVYGVSSAASGGDQLFAESCIELGIPLRVLLPKPADEFRGDFDDAGWKRTEKILEHALSVEVTGDRNRPKERYYDCGIQTVAESQGLLALWDGQLSRGTGGTEEIVTFAQKTDHPVTWIHAATGELQRLAGDAEAELEARRELDFLNALPDVGVAAPAAASTRELAVAWLNKMDENANRFAPQARRLASIPIVYTAAAAVLSGVAPEIPDAAPWLVVSAILGVVAVALPAALRIRKRQMLWVRTRTATEVSRSVLALWKTPSLYKVVGAEVIPELAAMLRSLNFLKMQDRPQANESLDDFKMEYRKDRVMHQVAYFSRQAAKAERQERRYNAVTWICGLLASLVAIGFLASRTRWMGAGSFHSRQWIALAMSSLFEIATMAGAFAAIKDCARRRRRYRELSGWLGHWDTELDALKTWTSVLQVAERIEKALVVELLEWRSLLQSAGHHRG